MSHMHKGDAKSTRSAKVSKMVGDGAAQRFIHPEDKASNLAYTANEKLDKLPRPTRESTPFNPPSKDV